MSDKLLSIIVPSYNMEAYLPKCLGSLVVDDAELLPKLEVLVVNDGSTDRTSEIAHEFADKHHDVFLVIDKSNGHYGSCVNAALKQITGRFVKIVDADDSVDSAGLCTLLRAIADCNDNAPDVFFADYEIVNPQGTLVEKKTLAFPADREFGIDELGEHADQVYMYNVAYRSELFKKFEYHQTEGICYTDAEWIFKPMAFVRKCRYVATPVYRYLVGRDGQTIELSEFVKNHAMLEQVESELFKFYDAHQDDAGVPLVYLRSLLGRIVMMLADIKLFHLSSDESKQHLAALKDICRDYPFLKDALDKQAVFEHSMAPFHYLRFALKHQSFGPLALSLTRRYVRFRHRGRCDK